MIRNTIVAAAIAATSFSGPVAHAATIDLAFIMDKSGSVGSQFAPAMNALADALAANIPVSGPDTYRIGVLTFSDNASVKVAPTVIDSQAALDGVVAAIKAGNGSGSGLTNYSAAFAAVGTAFSNAFDSLGETSLINMMTDGVPTAGTSTGFYGTAALQSAGWDSLSFESIGNSSGNALLADICFGPGNPPGGTDCPIYTSEGQITDPANVPFVLDLDTFAEYNAVIGSKVAKIVNPDPIDPIPVPAALPLLAGGLALIGFVGRRRRNAA